MIGRYAKTFVPVLLAVAYGLQAAITDNVVSNTEWLGIGILALNALGVWAVPNAPRSEVLPR